MCFHWCTHLRYGNKLIGSYLIPCAFSGATESASVGHDRRETVNIRTWPTISPAHMPSGHPGAQELSHWDGPCSGFVCERCGSRRFLGTAPRTCRQTRTAFDEAIVPILSSRQRPVNRSTIATKRLTRPCKRHHLIMVIVSTVTIDPESLTVAWWPIYQFIATMNSKSGSGNVNKHHLHYNFIAVYTK